MSYLKGILSAALAGAFIGFVALYTTYRDPSGCLDICISSPGLVGTIGAIAGFALGLVDGIVTGLISRFDWCTRPRHYALIGAGFVLAVWAVLSVSTGSKFLEADTVIAVVSGALMGIAYAAGANGLKFLRQL